MSGVLRKAGLSLAGLIALATLAQAQTESPVRIGNFSIDRNEVTVGAFRAYLGHSVGSSPQTAAEREGGGFEYAGGWARRPGWSWARPQGQPATDQEPVTHVTWDEARAFCAARGGRLPTLAEWRQAGFTETRESPTDGFERGRTYPFPVGANPEGMNNNRRHHVPVGTTKRGVNGLYDMGANVWEWLADRRGEDALTAGGSWWYGPDQARAEAVQWKAARFYAVYIGFRCAYDR